VAKDPIEQEMKDIPLELRQLRLDKSRAEKAVRDAFALKIRYLEEAGEVNKELAKAKEKLAAIRKEYAALSGEIKTELAKIREKKADNENASLRIQAQIDQIEAREQDCIKAQAKTKEDDERNKAKAQSLTEREVKLSIREDSLTKDEHAFAEKTGCIDEVQADREKVLDRREQELDGKFERVKSAVAELDKRMEAQSIKDAEITKRENDVRLREGILAKGEFDNEIDRKALSTQQDNIDRRNGILDERENALDNREKEIHLRELRFKKLIKDKNMEKELADLEKSLKP